MKRATIVMEDERMKFLTFKPLDGWGIKSLHKSWRKLA
jgi:hypothetical protein